MLAASRAIVTVEEIVDRFEAVGTNAVILPSWTIDAIVAVRRAARIPSYAHGYYARDNAFYVAWDAIARDRERFQRVDRGARHRVQIRNSFESARTRARDGLPHERTAIYGVGDDDRRRGARARRR